MHKIHSDYKNSLNFLKLFEYKLYNYNCLHLKQLSFNLLAFKLNKYSSINNIFLKLRKYFSIQIMLLIYHYLISYFNENT